MEANPVSSALLTKRPSPRIFILEPSRVLVILMSQVPLSLSIICEEIEEEDLAFETIPTLGSGSTLCNKAAGTGLTLCNKAAGTGLTLCNNSGETGLTLCSGVTSTAIASLKLPPSSAAALASSASIASSAATMACSSTIMRASSASIAFSATSMACSSTNMRASSASIAAFSVWSEISSKANTGIMVPPTIKAPNTATFESVDAGFE